MSIENARSGVIREFLERHDLQGWLSWRPDELVLQLGHTSYWGMSFLLSLQTGERILFAPEIEPRNTIPDGVELILYPWGHLGCANPFAVLTDKLNFELDKRRLPRYSIGISGSPGRSSMPIMAAEEPPIADHVLRKLCGGMTTSALLDDAFLGLYQFKTDHEIKQIRIANSVALAGLHAWRASLVPGITEAEAAAIAESAIHRKTGEPGIDSARGWAMVQSGSNTAFAGAFNRSSGKRISNGDLVLIELATCVNGYWSDLTRTEAVGSVSAQSADLLTAVRMAQQSAIRLLRPGVSAREVDAAARQVLEQAGLADYFTHATGHHVGFRYHDPGFAISPDSDGVLASGMVITIEPGAYLANYGMGARIEDNLAVTVNGAEILSAESRDLK
jgi:Xaa-Pro aminopeptidase